MPGNGRFECLCRPTDNDAVLVYCHRSDEHAQIGSAQGVVIAAQLARQEATKLCDGVRRNAIASLRKLGFQRLHPASDDGELAAALGQPIHEDGIAGDRRTGFFHRIGKIGDGAAQTGVLSTAQLQIFFARAAAACSTYQGRSREAFAVAQA